MGAEASQPADGAEKQPQPRPAPEPTASPLVLPPPGGGVDAGASVFGGGADEYRGRPATITLGSPQRPSPAERARGVPAAGNHRAVATAAAGKAAAQARAEEAAARSSGPWDNSPHMVPSTPPGSPAHRAIKMASSPLNNSSGSPALSLGDDRRTSDSASRERAAESRTKSPRVQPAPTVLVRTGSAETKMAGGVPPAALDVALDVSSPSMFAGQDGQEFMVMRLNAPAETKSVNLVAFSEGGQGEGKQRMQIPMSRSGPLAWWTVLSLSPGGFYYVYEVDGALACSRDSPSKWLGPEEVNRLAGGTVVEAAVAGMQGQVGCRVNTMDVKLHKRAVDRVAAVAATADIRPSSPPESYNCWVPQLEHTIDLYARPPPLAPAQLRRAPMDVWEGANDAARRGAGHHQEPSEAEEHPFSPAAGSLPAGWQPERKGSASSESRGIDVSSGETVLDGLQESTLATLFGGAFHVNVNHVYAMTSVPDMRESQSNPNALPPPTAFSVSTRYRIEESEGPELERRREAEKKGSGVLLGAAAAGVPRSKIYTTVYYAAPPEFTGEYTGSHVPRQIWESARSSASPSSDERRERQQGSGGVGSSGSWGRPAASPQFLTGSVGRDNAFGGSSSTDAAASFGGRSFVSATSQDSLERMERRNRSRRSSDDGSQTSDGSRLGRRGDESPGQRGDGLEDFGSFDSLSHDASSSSYSRRQRGGGSSQGGSGPGSWGGRASPTISRGGIGSMGSLKSLDEAHGGGKRAEH